MADDHEAILDRLRQEAAALPPSPGVYLMKDKSGQIIYVGKAKLLPRRVSSYFQKTPSSPRIGLMVTRIRTFDFVVTANEKESLILENSLIKKHRPRFNVVLRDDKTYPSLRLSVQEEFPRLEVVRRPARDGSVIFGPFPSTGAMRETVRMVQRLFPLRQCRRPDVKKIDRPCLNYQMGRCVGPCRPEMTPAAYEVLIDQVRLFFRGRHQDLIKSLTQEMKAAAAALEFEQAARLRDRLTSVRKTLERQVVAQIDDRDQDVLGIHQDQGLWQGALLSVRAGMVTGCLPLELAGDGQAEPRELLPSLLSQHYATGHFIPDDIYLPEALTEDDQAVLEDWLSGQKGRAVKIIVPQRGDRLRLLDMAKENAKAALTDRINHQQRTQGLLVELQARLGLSKIPRLLECFDLAHLQGESAVAGLVVMEGGEWKKESFRRFRIKTAQGGDDYAGLREVVARRFGHENWPAPDLLLIDGGKGQLAATLLAFEDLGLQPPPVAAIAEGREAGEIDRVFIPGRKEPVDLKAGSPGLLLLSRLRDEAHRFVRAYHHHLQSKKLTESPLLAVPGLGPARRRKLLDHFGSLEKLARAEDAEILGVVKLTDEGLTALREFLAERETVNRRPH